MERVLFNIFLVNNGTFEFTEVNKEVPQEPILRLILLAAIITSKIGTWNYAGNIPTGKTVRLVFCHKQGEKNYVTDALFCAGSPIFYLFSTMFRESFQSEFESPLEKPFALCTVHAKTALEEPTAQGT